MALITQDTGPDEAFALTAANYSGTSDFLVEQYVDGSEHSVSGVVADGTVRILGVTDKSVDGPLSPSWATAVPSALTDTQAEDLKRAAEQAVSPSASGPGGSTSTCGSAPRAPSSWRWADGSAGT